MHLAGTCSLTCCKALTAVQQVDMIRTTVATLPPASWPPCTAPAAAPVMHHLCNLGVHHQTCMQQSPRSKPACLIVPVPGTLPRAGGRSAGPSAITGASPASPHLCCLVVHHLFRCQITLVAHEQLVDVLIGVSVNLIEPLLHVVEALLVCHIVHNLAGGRDSDHRCLRTGDAKQGHRWQPQS